MKGDYQPKVGDRVTVAGDDREWVVDFVARHHVDIAAVVDRARWGLSVLPSMLTPVPTPPPEPPRFIHYAGGAYRRTTGNVYGPIPVLIDPADPDQIRDAGLCRVDDVDAWMSVDLCQTWLPKKFRERFGGDGDD